MVSVLQRFRAFFVAVFAVVLLLPGTALADDVTVSLPAAPSDYDYSYQMVLVDNLDNYYFAYSEAQFAFDSGTALTYVDGQSHHFVMYQLVDDSWIVVKDSDLTRDNNFFGFGLLGSTIGDSYKLVWCNEDVVSQSGTYATFYSGDQTGYVTSFSGGDSDGGGSSDSGEVDLNPITELLSSIADFFGGFFDNLKDFLIGLVVPDEAWFDGKLDDLNSQFSSLLGFDMNVFDFTALVDDEGWVDDSDFSVSFSFLGFDQELSLFNSSFLVQAVVFFRPFIRGFIVLLWCFFAVNQVLSILGHQEIVGRGQVPGQMRMDI